MLGADVVELCNRNCRMCSEKLADDVKKKKIYKDKQFEKSSSTCY